MNTTTVYTVVAIEEDSGTVLFLGHLVAGLPCPVCAAFTETDVRRTRCEQPKAHAAILIDQYADMTGVEVRSRTGNYRGPVNRKLWQKVAFVTREELGVTA